MDPRLYCIIYFILLLAFFFPLSELDLAIGSFLSPEESALSRGAIAVSEAVRCSYRLQVTAARRVAGWWHWAVEKSGFWSQTCLRNGEEPKKHPGAGARVRQVQARTKLTTQRYVPFCWSPPTKKGITPDQDELRLRLYPL